MKTKMNFLKLFTVLLALVIGMMGCKEKEEEAIRVALNLPLTGDFATYGKAIQDGALFALEEIEKKSNTEIKFVFDWQDNAGVPRNTVNVFHKQILKPIDVYISGVKPQTMSIIDLVSEKNIPHFVWVFDAFITEQYTNTYRTWVSFKYEPIIFLNYINKIEAERIAIIYVELPHTNEEFNDILIPQLTDKELFVERFQMDLNDFKNIAAKVKTFEPDLIILSGFKNHLLSMVKTFREYDLIHNNNTLCSYDLLDAALDLDKNTLEHLRVVTPYFEISEDSIVKKWKNDFYQKYNRKPKYTEAYSYDMVNIIYDVFLRIPKGTEITSDIFRKYLLETNMTGITGDISFDETGDLIVDLRVGVYKDGKLKEDRNNGVVN
jgi:branched-chain amino acid transport system substrate-binding protein